MLQQSQNITTIRAAAAVDASSIATITAQLAQADSSRRSSELPSQLQTISAPPRIVVDVCAILAYTFEQQSAVKPQRGTCTLVSILWPRVSRIKRPPTTTVAMHTKIG